MEGRGAVTEQAICTWLDGLLSPILGEKRVFLSCCPDLGEGAAVAELSYRSAGPVCKASCTVRCFSPEAGTALHAREAVRPALSGTLNLSGKRVLASPNGAGLRYQPGCGQYEGWVSAELTFIEEEQA